MSRQKYDIRDYPGREELFRNELVGWRSRRLREAAEMAEELSEMISSTYPMQAGTATRLAANLHDLANQEATKFRKQQENSADVEPQGPADEQP